MKKRAHIPHNYEMSFEIRREGPASGIHPSRKAQQYVSFNGRLMRQSAQFLQTDKRRVQALLDESQNSFHNYVEYALSSS